MISLALELIEKTHVRIAIMSQNKFRMCVVAALLLAPALLHAASLNSKPGAWEITTMTKMPGMAIPADAMANLPEAQRARIEAAMGSRMGKSHSTTIKSCVTQKDLDEDRIVKSDEDRKCTRKIISKTATSMVMEQSCPAPQAHTSRMSVQASSPTAMAATIDITRPDGFKMHIDMKGRWLGASCAGIKE
jgi:Protein of unknown function (DUF3617)